MLVLLSPDFPKQHDLDKIVPAHVGVCITALISKAKSLALFEQVANILQTATILPSPSSSPLPPGSKHTQGSSSVVVLTYLDACVAIKTAQCKPCPRAHSQ